MPKRTLETVRKAEAALKKARDAHHDIRNLLTTIVLRVMAEVYADNPAMPGLIKTHGQQLPLGERFAEVLERCQKICGITISEEGLKERDFGPTRHAVDIAIGMNEWGVEVEHSFEYHVMAASANVCAILGLSQHVIVPPWQTIGERCPEILENIRRGSGLSPTTPISAESTFNELVMSLEGAKVAQA